MPAMSRSMLLARRIALEYMMGELRKAYLFILMAMLFFGTGLISDLLPRVLPACPNNNTGMAINTGGGSFTNDTANVTSIGINPCNNTAFNTTNSSVNSTNDNVDNVNKSGAENEDCKKKSDFKELNEDSIELFCIKVSIISTFFLVSITAFLASRDLKFLPKRLLNPVERAVLNGNGEIRRSDQFAVVRLSLNTLSSMLTLYVFLADLGVLVVMYPTFLQTAYAGQLLAFFFYTFTAFSLGLAVFSQLSVVAVSSLLHQICGKFRHS